MDVTKLNTSPAGTLAPTVEGQKAFVPNPLPRTVELDSQLVYQLDEASRAVAKLGGIGETLANPHLLIRPFLRREAVLSSKIEGTQASLSDLLLFEASRERKDPSDAREVANYITALERGLELLEEIPISMRLISQMHSELLVGTRGDSTVLGEIRTQQNWIGARGTPIEEARYIPPPAPSLPQLLTDWERFVNSELKIPPLVKCAMMHYQFEAIHPYLDGNGRLGRLLIVLFLCACGVLPKPLLYLSAYFDNHRDAYYDGLYNVSLTGDWNPWLNFFLKGVAEQASDAIERSTNVRELYEKYRITLQERRASANVMRLLDELFVNPWMTVPRAHEMLGVSREGAKQIVNRMLEAGILEYRFGSWPKIYTATELLKLLEAPVASA